MLCQINSLVIPSERSESRDLRTFVTAEQTFGAKILRRVSLAQDDKTNSLCVFYTALSHNCPAGACHPPYGAEEVSIRSNEPSDTQEE